MSKEYLKIGNASFNIEACAQMSFEEFKASHKGIVNHDLALAHAMIRAAASKPELTDNLPALREVAQQSLTLSETANGGDVSTGKKGPKAKRGRADEGDSKKPGSESEGHSAEHAESAL